jgi:hypothetical protein
MVCKHSDTTSGLSAPRISESALVFEKDHVALRLLPFRRVGADLLAIGRDDNRKESADPDPGFWFSW